MTSFLLYQLKAGICILLFTGLYYALFRQETFHRFNRFYLLGTLLLSFLLPTIRVQGLQLDTEALPVRFIGAVSVYAGQVAASGQSRGQFLSILPAVYLSIALLFAGALGYQLFQLLRLLFRLPVSTYGNYSIAVLPGKGPSFSFFRRVFLDPEAAATLHENQVLQHEIAHARQWHSTDIMLIQLIKILQWFNPFLYLAEKALQETHEYLADEAVLEQNGQTDRYRLLLLTQVFGVQPGILNFFNQSLLKNRLTMMTKEKSPLRNRFKYLAALPLLLAIGLLMCCSLKEKEKLAPPPPPPPPPPEEMLKSETEGDEGAYVVVDETAQFQGGDINAFRDWVQQHVVYPPEAVKKGIFGKVTVQFVVGSTGKISDIKVLRGVDPLLDAETIRVISTSPDWVPGKKAGKNVKQQFIMPVIFKLE